MQYDKVKHSLGVFFNKYIFMRKLFYSLLDLLLLRSWHIRMEIQKWKKTISASVKILDAGSGFGQYTYYLAKKIKNSEIKGLDIKPEQIEDCNGFAQKAGLKNVIFEMADLTKLDEKPIYDLVITVDVMEHILEDELVFQNFYKLLKPAGILLISTPSDQGGSDVHDHGDESFIDEHVRDGYGIQDITDKLKRSGFSQVEAKYSYGKAGSISWRLSMKYPMQMLNVSKLFFILLPVYYVLTYPFAYLLNWIDLYSQNKTGTGLIVKATK